MRRLGSGFGGRRVTGVGFDQDTLREAGIEEAGAFAAVSSGDNSNIIAARVAREMFGIENVAARIYDPRRAEVYQRLGIPTVATVRWTADQMLRRLLPSGAEPLWSDPSGGVQLAEVHTSPAWIGHKISRLQDETGVRVAFLTRLGEAIIPGGKETFHLVNEEVMRALGPKGILVNVARGSVVDEAALVKCLQEGALGGAGLDVFEEEPKMPEALWQMENVVLTPHIGSATHETRAAMSRLTLDRYWPSPLRYVPPPVRSTRSGAPPGLFCA